MNQIASFDLNEDLETLSAIETKINTTILPIRKKLAMKIEEARNEISKPESKKDEECVYSGNDESNSNTTNSKKRRRSYKKKPPEINELTKNNVNQFAEKNKSREPAQHSPIGISESLSERNMFFGSSVNEDGDNITTIPFNDGDAFSGFNTDDSDNGLYDASTEMFLSGYELGFNQFTRDHEAFGLNSFDQLYSDSATIFSPINNNPSQESVQNFTVSNSNTEDLTVKKFIINEITPDEYISPKRRRRLNQIVPNPRKSRSVQYQCSLCHTNYQMSVQDNAWWAVYVHECPSCMNNQIPRIDINFPCNSIDLDPNIVALYGEGVDDEDDGGLDANDYEDDSDDDNSVDNQEEDESFVGDESLCTEDASKLLVLMCHARTCTGCHISEKHAEICKSTKFLMLHIRDCNGFDSFGNECKFPWCTSSKKMLQHLTRCYEPNKCSICNPANLPESLRQLQTINHIRSQNAQCN